MTTRQQQIIGAMTGRQAALVADNSLHDAVKSALVEIGTQQGRPLTVSAIPSMISAVLRTAAKTLIFEGEVPLALRMGAAGELDHEATNLTQTNCTRWIAAYAVSGDRRAAQEYISIQSARDRARTDAVANDALRRDFEQNGLRRAWEAFARDGWDFRPGYAAALYPKIGKDVLREWLTAKQMQEAKDDARADYRRANADARHLSDEELDLRPALAMYWKARLVRAYFETLQAQGLTIDYNPQPHPAL